MQKMITEISRSKIIAIKLNDDDAGENDYVKMAMLLFFGKVEAIRTVAS